MEALKGIAVDSSDFGEIRRGGKVYVDKTGQLMPLISGDNGMAFFLSRPRRFGKSLMISTLKALFEARRELFKGLAIDLDPNWKWEKWPVIHLSFNDLRTDTIETFNSEFESTVERSLVSVGASYDRTRTPGDNFRNYLSSLDENHKVVVLIDEYDAPICHSLDDEAKAKTIRNILSALYATMKDRTGVIRFLLITGVTKFSSLSIFSQLSNLTDLSFDSRCATMFGYTQEELEENFGPHLRRKAKLLGMEYDDFISEFKRMYDGYRFGLESEVKVYNPFSTGRALASTAKYFEFFWAKSGRASVLMNMISRVKLTTLDFESIRDIPDEVFAPADINDIQAEGLLQQSGYLTITDYDGRGGFTLGVPNDEVRADLHSVIVRAFQKEPDGLFARGLTGSLDRFEFDTFRDALASFYAGLVYGPKEGKIKEAAYQRILYTLLTTRTDFKVTQEVAQSKGRADIVAETAAGIFVFELKVDGGGASEAMRQIEERYYCAPYITFGKPVYAIGLGFKGEGHLLDSFEWKKMN